jgi:tRNA pseudouridine-54 N-methylase
VLLKENEFEKDVQIWTFLDNYGTFIFDSEQLDYSSFPKNELLLADWFKKLIEGNNLENVKNPLNSVKRTEKEIIEAINDFKKLGYEVYTLSENGQDFFNCVEDIQTKNKLLFIVGNQTGDFIASDVLLDLKLPSLSFGSGSYLASSIIRLIKLYLLT